MHPLLRSLRAKEGKQDSSQFLGEGVIWEVERHNHWTTSSVSYPRNMQQEFYVKILPCICWVTFQASYPFSCCCWKFKITFQCLTIRLTARCFFPSIRTAHIEIPCNHDSHSWLLQLLLGTVRWPTLTTDLKKKHILIMYRYSSTSICWNYIKKNIKEPDQNVKEWNVTMERLSAFSWLLSQLRTLKKVINVLSLAVGELWILYFN